MAEKERERVREGGGGGRGEEGSNRKRGGVVSENETKIARSV